MIETIGCFGMLGAYFVPSMIAYWREHKQFVPLFIMNIFFGWTGIGWIICLIWSFWCFEKKQNWEVIYKTRIMNRNNARNWGG